MPFDDLLQSTDEIIICQRKELAEMFGFESRNKYEILNRQGTSFGFAAEDGKSFLGFLLRHWLGHWRSFTIHLFDSYRQPILQAEHPFRILLQEMELKDERGKVLGRLKQRFTLLQRVFDIEDARGRVLMTVSSPVWKLWTFEVRGDTGQVATIEKKWSGFLEEAFTDADRFRIVVHNSRLGLLERKLLVMAAIFVDLQYFEAKAE
jgi:uncharacterized protein YxjI